MAPVASWEGNRVERLEQQDDILVAHVAAERVVALGPWVHRRCQRPGSRLQICQVGCWREGPGETLRERLAAGGTAVIKFGP